MIHQDQRVNGSDKQKQFSIFNRSTAELRSFSVNIGGELFPTKGILMSENNFGEPIMEHMIANNVLNDMYHTGSFNCTSATTFDAATTAVTAQGKNQLNYTKICGWDKHQVDLADWKDVHQENAIGSFYMSYGLEKIRNPNHESGISSGIATLGDDVSIETTYACNPVVLLPLGSGEETDMPMDVRFYATYDAILMLDPVTRTWSKKT